MTTIKISPAISVTHNIKAGQCVAFYTTRKTWKAAVVVAVFPTLSRVAVHPLGESYIQMIDLNERILHTADEGHLGIEAVGYRQVDEEDEEDEDEHEDPEE